MALEIGKVGVGRRTSIKCSRYYRKMLLYLCDVKEGFGEVKKGRS